MNLKTDLKKVSEQFEKSVSKETFELIDAQIQLLAKKKLRENTLKVGEYIPDFTLNNAVGEQVNIYDLLNEGPIILSFYRGNWCPYCNLELVAYQEKIDEIQGKGAQFVAVSPELPDLSLSLIERHSLKYEILSDIDNGVARDFGLVFKLSNELSKLYMQFGIDLEKEQNNSNDELPVPATYVIDESGKIMLAALNIDYRERIDPELAISIL